ncbi:MAG: hypothetical protein CYPHOPRED_002172 [Cyphobasidiales sp. Tagirdzhanova-0007]|nr:MAG: hypothetical protein CYPHOPRED_002172 [Cyphobasidiales sp. Tagirdzhanova-0007]
MVATRPPPSKRREKMAGKVKSQTPKTTKQERKVKRYTGRVKKRHQYTKRFINPVLTNGKRKANPAPAGKMG